MSNLVNIITKISGKNHATNNNNINNNAGKMSFDRSRAKNPDDTPFGPNEYCWSHSYHVNFNHSNENWKYQAEGYKTEATRANLMGRKNKNKDLVKGLWQFEPGEKKSKDINIVNNLNEISKNPPGTIVP